MKKLLGLTFVALFMMSMANIKIDSNYLSIEKEKDLLCNQIATIFLNALEDEFGCFDDAEEANDVYQELVVMCENY